jgi:hypothetical protein
MQTFLPYKSFKKSAKVLDWRRLGKQRVEGFQILNTLVAKKEGITHIAGRKIGWLNHPASLMWEGYENCLRLYVNTMIKEWINRKYKNTMQIYEIEQPVIYPEWLGTDDFHASHRSNLLRKDYDYYSQFNWAEGPDMEYVWPVKNIKKEDSNAIQKKNSV